MPADIIDTFLTASTADRLRMVRDPNNTAALKGYLGQAAYDDYARLAGRLDEGHLSVTHPTNLIFIPGVMGSLLQSKTKGGIWWVDVRTRHHIDDLRLSPDGQQDADINNQVLPCSIDPSYEAFLTAALERDDFGHDVFAYDWRKPLGLSAARLRDLVVSTYEANGREPVHLVAHSMGGLMVRATLMAYGQELWPKLGRIVFIGTPHYGSPAIAGYLKNHLWGFELMALMGLYLSRDTYRSLWGVLGMLPAPAGIYPGTRPGDPAPWTSGNDGDSYVHPCVNFDLYKADSWRLDLTTEQTSELQKVLDGAADFHRKMYEAHQALGQELRDRMLVIAGVGFKTLFRLAYAPQFFGLWERMTKETDRIPGDPHREGDGRVPLASASLESVSIRYVKGVHGGLPNLPEVYGDVFRWLNEENLKLPDTPQGALSQHLAAGEGESAAPHLDGTARGTPFTDDPNLWDLTRMDDARVAALETELEAGRVPEFSRIRLL